MTLDEHLIEIGACAEARDWAAGMMARDAWAQCTEAGWLAWWLRHIHPGTREELIRMYWEAGYESAYCDAIRARWPGPPWTEC